YAYRHRADFDVIWWIPAELPVQIQKSLVELGQRLDLVDSNEVNVVVDVVMDALKGNTRGGRQIPPNWLLVFDNAEDPEKVLEYLPTGGPGRILVTSRNSQWLNLARPLEVDVFQRQESIELLQRRDPQLNEDDGDRLASALGDLPLAIEQAAAWRAETGMPADEYIQLLDEKQAEMLGLPGALEYQRSVAAAWNVSLDKLRASNPTALRILQACAYFAPEPIPRSMFANARSVSVVPDLDRALRDRLRLNEAIRDINRYALARIDHRTNSIQMHRLVQAVLISQMTEDDQKEMRHAAHLLLAANAPDAPDDDAQWPKYGQLYPHVIASGAIECDDAGVRELVFNQTQYLYHWGEHDASRGMAKQVYDIWFAHLGADHPDTLKVGRWLGFMLWIAGEYGQAAEFNAELLETHRRAFGEDHEDTIAAIDSVGGDRRARGDFTGALELSRANHQRCVERFGDYDPLTLTAAHNLGVSLRLSGLFAEALESDDQTWRRKVEAYGSDHLLSLLTQAGITLDRRESGDYLEARTEHEDIVARYRTLYGPLHHTTLRVIRLQSGMRRKAGDHEGAREAADEAYRGLSDRYGPDHPETVAAALSRSINYRQAGELDQAQQVGTDVLNRYQRTLGAGHPHTLSARTGLAVVSRLRGQVAEARKLNEEALQGLRARLGEDHPSTIVVSINLASDLFALGEVTAAHELDVDTTERAARVLAEDHPTTLAGNANLAQDLRALGREQEGNALRTDVVTKTAARLGNTHPAVGEFANPDLRANCDIDPMPL
ncbi:MAG TPA: FxSxx-COOH system tetratricopeptide repeat protein, partial [Pseudonocardiaceae bacterium]|nr:FxSxx-COOH system tetratricopeptide repeat protein [Pseudonocardiaceae bacterium]